MGLMDNIKKAQEMAQQAAQQGGAGQMSPSAGEVEYANLAMKLNQSGLPGVATINSITGRGAEALALQRSVDAAAHAGRRARRERLTPPARLPAWHVGCSDGPRATSHQEDQQRDDAEREQNGMNDRSARDRDDQQDHACNQPQH
jgi:hypothetical protein